ncbi:hypothetical protein CAEBREN_12403 [Caenorhabditis brenneri]|uniref:C-type lectin domain-containing protein n=1 Tax=Caenorhabditis brenneri TaxID=135651 RepID=G0PBU2_CAEBE|nr:hypothetical protein CAEBREN_12403 [Caenorhabditis brenneri]
MNQPDAANYCKAGYQGVLTGLENEEEFNYIVEEGLKKLQQPIETDFRVYNYSGVWVNGDRKSSCKNLPQTPRPATCNGTNEFTFTDPLLSVNPTGYLWGTSQPSGYRSADSNCIYVQFNNSALKTSFCDDYLCNLTVSSPNSTVFFGYACGVEPVMLT